MLATDKGQETGAIKSIFAFQNWQYTGGLLSTNPSVTITADPSLKEFYATFSVQHALTLNISLCQGPNCIVPGRVLVNDLPYSADADIWFNHGSVIRLVAEPAPGFVFDGWEGVDNQKITGFLNIVTLNYPTVVRPRFVLARHISLTTKPAELDLFADRGRVNTPSMLDWAYGSTHTLGVPSPQQLRNGSWWTSSRWSDGASRDRSYTVEPGGEIKTFTAVFVPATATDLRTSPPGLNLVVDGRDNWPAFLFPWGAGETHQIEAPVPADRPAGPGVAVQLVVKRRAARAELRGAARSGRGDDPVDGRLYAHRPGDGYQRGPGIDGFQVDGADWERRERF